MERKKTYTLSKVIYLTGLSRSNLLSLEKKQILPPSFITRSGPHSGGYGAYGIKLKVFFADDIEFFLKSDAFKKAKERSRKKYGADIKKDEVRKNEMRSISFERHAVHMARMYD